jgi:hypothetical protein
MSYGSMMLMRYTLVQNSTKKEETQMTLLGFFKSLLQKVSFKK